MALNLTDSFPTQTDLDPAYTWGKGRNVTTPGDNTGTPWMDIVMNDIFGFQQSLLTEAGLVPSGAPDEIGASQYLDALKSIAGSPELSPVGRAWAVYDNSGAVVSSGGNVDGVVLGALAPVFATTPEVGYKAEVSGLASVKGPTISVTGDNGVTPSLFLTATTNDLHTGTPSFSVTFYNAETDPLAKILLPINTYIEVSYDRRTDLA